MRDMCKRYYGDVPAVIVEPGVKTGVPVLTDNPKEVGTDRVINVLLGDSIAFQESLIPSFGNASEFEIGPRG